MKFKLVEKFNLSEDVFFHKAYRDKNGNVVDDQGIPIDPKITPDLAKRFSPFWDKDDDDIIDPSEYNPFTDGIYPDWDGENESDGNGDGKGNGNDKGEQGNEGDEEGDSGDTTKDGDGKGKGGQSKNGDKGDTTKDGDGNNPADVDGQEKEKREYSNNSTNNKGGGSGGGGGNGPSNGGNSGGKGGNGNPKNKNQQDENENEDRRIFIDTSTGKRYKKVNDKYVEI